MGDAQTNKLYVNLIALTEGNIFTLLPGIMQRILSSSNNNNNNNNEDDCDIINNNNVDETFNILLPSDDEWQTKVYYKLVEKQRLVDANNQQQDDSDDKIEQKTKQIDDLVDNSNIDETINERGIIRRKSSLKSSNFNSINWSVGDISKAGCLLNIQSIDVDFEDEQEMRRVYTLIYNVFRYKNIMMHALNDVNFFENYPQLSSNKPHVWLLLYDLYCRNFKKRDNKSSLIVSKLFDKVVLLEIENALWVKRIKLAASLARLRIENKALCLSNLLPYNLSNITGINNDLPVTCWINIRKVIDPSEICEQIESKFNLKLQNDDKSDCYKWDKYCPNMLIFPSILRTNLARSSLIKHQKLIIQDRSFCLGPTIFNRILIDLELTGNVVQTHINSPRSSAYLANLLSTNEKINKLIIFNAGDRRNQYEHYFKQLDINNVIVSNYKLTDLSRDIADMEEVIAVFATPPNSYSSVKDPIDLICSRGGDLSMLEILTESDNNKESKERVYRILNEQKRTLMYSMSRPQIQFVLYETHSGMDIENNEMVHKTINEINRFAKLHHASLQGKTIQISNRNQEINNNENELETGSIENERFSFDDLDEEKLLSTIQIPDTDIFDIVQLPNLSKNDKNCENFENDGCYLALLQRRNVIRLDNKYMIQMAENRGLFGQTTSPTLRDNKTIKNTRRKQEEIKPKLRKIRKLNNDELLRIAAPTHTFLRHTWPINQIIDCPKYKLLIDFDRKLIIYKQWWMDVIYYLFKLKKNMEKNKIISIDKINNNNNEDSIFFLNKLLKNTIKIDEIVAINRRNNQRILPRLRLTRRVQNKRNVKLPISITLIGDNC